VAVAFATIYTTYNTLNYVIQLATVIRAGCTWTVENPGGTQGPLSLLNQSPHSLVWDVDALGFIFLSLSTLFAFPVFEKRGLQLWVRRFLANALIIPLSCIAYFYPGYSVGQLLFGLPWEITVPGSLLLLALYFRRTRQYARSAARERKPGGKRRRLWSPEHRAPAAIPHGRRSCGWNSRAGRAHPMAV